MKTGLIIFTLSTMLSGMLLGQPNRQFYFSTIEVQANASQLLPQDDTLTALKGDYMRDAELNLIFSTTGSKPWHAFYHYPTVGVSAKLIDFKKPKKLGYGVSLMPFITFRLIAKNKFYSDFRFGIGLAYVTQKYHPVSNPTNVAISSSVNFIGNLRFGLGYQVSDKTKIAAYINATHLSNGSTNKPNYGLNTAGFGLGLTHCLTGSKPKAEICESSALPKSFALLSLRAGVKETGEAGGPKYFPVTAQLSYISPINQIIECGISVDVIYDKSIKYHILKNHQGYSPPNDNFNLGIAPRIQFPFYRLTSFFEFGIYLYSENPEYSLIYQRLGVNYRLTNRFSATVALKTHLENADHIDWGMTMLL